MLARSKVVLDVHPKSNDEINDNRTTKSEKGNINEVQTDSSRTNIEPFS
jgi:hypothetical protein